MANYYPNGIGASLGASLATVRPLLLSGDVWYVGPDGTDAAAPAGQNRERPLETLAQAITNAANGDVIVLLSDYDESCTAFHLLNKRLTIVGEGRADGKPTVKLRNNQASEPIFRISAARVELVNILFEASEQTCSKAGVEVGGNYFRMRDCYVECGDEDTAFPYVSLESFAVEAEFRDCVFASVATEPDSQPLCAMRATVALSGLRLTGVTFSGGEFGWAAFQALQINEAMTDLRCEDLSLLLGADVYIESASTGYVHVAVATGGARVEWH